MWWGWGMWRRRQAVVLLLETRERETGRGRGARTGSEFVMRKERICHRCACDRVWDSHLLRRRQRLHLLFSPSHENPRQFDANA